MAASRSGRGRRVRLADMDNISTEDVKSSDVLVGKLSAQERRVGEDILHAVRKAQGTLSAEEVSAALDVDVSLIVELWSADE